MTEPVLEAVGLAKSYGALVVVDRLTLQLERGARHALIGPNGAGKTTCVGLLSGVVRADAGRITLMGSEITHVSAQRRVKQGLVRSFQINNLFRRLSVLENVYLAVSEQLGARGDMISFGGRRHDILDRVEQVIETLGLAADRHRRVAEMAYGRQRLVEIAIALSLEPRVLLLDEPTAGVPKGELRRLLDTIEGLPSEIAILMIEHDMQVVRRFAQHISVMVAGSILMEGRPDAVMASEQVRTVYLGQASYAQLSEPSRA